MTAVTPEAERRILDALAAARARALVEPTLVERAARIEQHLNIEEAAEPPRSIGELIERGGHLYPCLNLTAIGGER